MDLRRRAAHESQIRHPVGTMATEVKNRKPSFWEAMTSPVGRKITTGATGLGWVIFIILHLIGNLGYFSPGNTFNEYSHFLLSLGPLLWFLEGLLLLGLILHVAMGIDIYLRKKRSRQHGYKEYKSMGRPSLQTPSSRSMIFTGIVILGFLFIHVGHFKFEIGVEGEYLTSVAGVEMRDLKRLMTETFQNPWFAFGYPIVMILLGFHLRHGIWSAFQSLGTMNRRLTPIIYGVGTVLAILLAIGFLFIPLYIYFAV